MKENQEKKPRANERENNREKREKINEKLERTFIKIFLVNAFHRKINSGDDF